VKDQRLMECVSLYGEPSAAISSRMVTKKRKGGKKEKNFSFSLPCLLVTKLDDGG
jgi:hypothetical protein